MKNFLFIAAVVALVSCTSEPNCDCSPECAAKCHGDSLAVDSIGVDSTSVVVVDTLLDTVMTKPVTSVE
jgi:hypothetical protein